MTAIARQRITAWIATFAVLLAALVPTWAASAVRDGRSLPLVEICTAKGVSAQPAGPGSPSPDQAMATEHCLWCTFHSPSALPSNGHGNNRPALDATGASLPPEVAGWYVARPPLRTAPRGPPVIA